MIDFSFIETHDSSCWEDRGEKQKQQGRLRHKERVAIWVSEVENGVMCFVEGPCIYSHCATWGRDKWCDWASMCVFVTCRYFLVCMHTLILLWGNTAVPLTYYSWWSVFVCACARACVCVCQVPAVNSLRPFRRAQAFINKKSSNATFVWAEVTRAPQCISSLPFPPHVSSEKEVVIILHLVTVCHIDWKEPWLNLITWAQASCNRRTEATIAEVGQKLFQSSMNWHRKGICHHM